MKVLVTAGSTITMIDKVRAITNIFEGHTGTQIAQHFCDMGHDVTLLSSSPRLVYQGPRQKPVKLGTLQIIKFKTFDDLLKEMKKLITGESYDVIIHSAAVSDYKTDGIFTPACRLSDGTIIVKPIGPADKIPSSLENIFISLVPTEKIIDFIKREWGFRGKLVKFKLQANMSDAELIKVAKQSALYSGADLVVANCREWFTQRAYIIDLKTDMALNVSRENLPARLYMAVLS